MKNTKVTLIPLTVDDREQFILDNQWAFKYGAMMEFGERDDHIDDDGEIISRKTIEHCIDEPSNETYRIMLDGKRVGGLILKIDKETQRNHLEILFVLPEAHSKGIGYGAWREVEALRPETKIWETSTPYFEKRNIHFYVNKCGFQIVEFYHAFHTDPNCPKDDHLGEEGPDVRKSNALTLFHNIKKHLGKPSAFCFYFHRKPSRKALPVFSPRAR